MYAEMQGAVAADRSQRREVRNPILALPAVRKLDSLCPEARQALIAVLNDVAADARQRADKSWKQNKGPMAAYWKAVGVYAKHIRAVLRKNAP